MGISRATEWILALINLLNSTHPKLAPLRLILNIYNGRVRELLSAPDPPS